MATSGVGPAWRIITIDDGTEPVGFARLDRDPSGEFAALVRFPAGWRRPNTGRYAVDEELFVLEGEFRMSGVAYRTNDYAYLPAGYLRTASAAPGGALMIAFFAGAADWIRAPRADPAAPVPPVAWRDLPVRTATVAAVARSLSVGPGRATWLAEERLAERAPAGEHVQLFSIPAREWATVEPGRAIPPLRTPCLCRLRRIATSGVDRDLSDK